MTTAAADLPAGEGASRLSVSYSDAELLTLAELLEAPGLGDLTLSGAESELEPATRDAVLLGLVARRVVQPDDSTEPTSEGTAVYVTEPHATVLGALVAPDALLSVQVSRPPDVEQVNLFVQEDVLVVQDSRWTGVSDFALLDASALHDEILAIAELDDREPGDGDFELDVDRLSELEQGLAASDGVATASFAAAVADPVLACRILGQVGPEESGALSLGWVDDGERLWLLRETGEANRVHVLGATTDEARRALEAALAGLAPRPASTARD